MLIGIAVILAVLFGLCVLFRSMATSLQAVCALEVTGGRAVGGPVVISHRGALQGFAPGSRASISRLQQQAVCRFDLDVTLVENEYIIGHPRDIARGILNQSSVRPSHVDAIIGNLTMDKVVTRGGEVMTLEEALTLILKTSSGPCRESERKGGLRLPLVLLEPKGLAASKNFVQALSTISDRLGGWQDGAVALWLNDTDLASFTLSEFEKASEKSRKVSPAHGCKNHRASQVCGPVRLLYPIKQYEPLQAHQVRREAHWTAAGPPCRTLSPGFTDAAKRRGQSVLCWVVDSKSDACKAAALGAIAVVSDAPVQLLQQLHSGG